MGYVAFTVDVDRDVNEAVEGSTAAVSRGERGLGYRFSSSLEGVEVLISMFDDLGLSSTFFLEGETAENMSTLLLNRLGRHEVASHGYSHEDLTGQTTGVTLSKGELRAVLEKGRESLEKELGKKPKGFRAPYLHINNTVLDELERMFVYDSSLVMPMVEGTVSPYWIREDLIEMPIAITEDERGDNMYSYLWPLLEGDRGLSDYLHIVDKFEEGLLVLATHSWHIVETFGGGKLDSQDVSNNLKMLREIVDYCRDAGFRFTTLEDYLSVVRG